MGDPYGQNTFAFGPSVDDPSEPPPGDAWPEQDTFDAETASAKAAQVLGPAPPSPAEPPSLNGHLPDTQIAAFLTDDFWAARSYLDHMRRAAWSRGRSAEALLGVVLARVAADTGHVVKLPATVGSRSGLSLIVALTGPPGSGKSSCKNIATELVPAQLLEPECDDVPPGSGEGLIEVLFEWVDEGDGKRVKRQTRHNAFCFADEGEVLAQQARRNTSNTILPVLRSVFTDGTLGQANASDATKRRVTGGRYVYGIVLGIQPDKAGPLFDDAGGGTPQRFLWMPTDAPVPPPGERPCWPGELPRARLDFTGQPDGWKYLAVSDNVADEIRHRDHQRQQHGCVPLDEHADLIRLKVAGILAILDGRTDINDVDWALGVCVRFVVWPRGCGRVRTGAGSAARGRGPGL